jgi:hypothetical protein
MNGTSTSAPEVYAMPISPCWRHAGQENAQVHNTAISDPHQKTLRAKSSTSRIMEPISLCPPPLYRAFWAAVPQRQTAMISRRLKDQSQPAAVVESRWMKMPGYNRSIRPAGSAIFRSRAQHHQWRHPAAVPSELVSRWPSRPA